MIDIISVKRGQLTLAVSPGLPNDNTITFHMCEIKYSLGMFKKAYMLTWWQCGERGQMHPSDLAK